MLSNMMRLNSKDFDKNVKNLTKIMIEHFVKL